MKNSLPPALVPPVTNPTKIQIAPIQGRMPDSLNEYLVAWALDKLRIDYQYQVPLGALGTRGSQVIDFVVWVGGGGIPVFLQGRHWHTTSTETEDALKQQAAQQRYHNLPVVLREEQTDTYQHAMQACKENFL